MLPVITEYRHAIIDLRLILPPLVGSGFGPHLPVRA